MPAKIKVRLQRVIDKINLPTVIKTAVLPGETTESLFVATQTGEIFYIKNGTKVNFLDIRQQVLKLGLTAGGYDERGLIGMAFHPKFAKNGLFYLHYTKAGSQGPGAIPVPFKPDPCKPETLNLKWDDRDNRYDHIDTVEEWIYQSKGQIQKLRTLLNLKRPFLNHNGVNSLNFSPETGKLILTTGDGGAGYDPFNAAQNYMEIAGKIIQIDINKNTSAINPPAVTRFNELPKIIQDMLAVIAKGVRNIPGISFLRIRGQYIKYVGIVGQDAVESIYSFVSYKTIPVVQIVQASPADIELNGEGFINFGWRGWEGDFPSLLIRECPANPELETYTVAYYDDALKTSTLRLPPLTCYYHHDSRPGKFGGSALTGVQPYMGIGIPGLYGNVVFTDFAQNDESKPPVRGVLAYTGAVSGSQLNDYNIIETSYDFGDQSSYYVSLGTNQNQTRLYLGVYGSSKVADPLLGTIFEIIKE